MKKIILIMSVFALATSAWSQHVPKEGPSFLDNLTVSPYGVVRHVNIYDGPAYGAGLDLGYNVNSFVSIHFANTAWQADSWGGSTIDESSALVKADLAKYRNETVKLYALGGVDRNWERSDWAFGAGLGAELRLGKNVSLGLDSRIRAWFEDSKDVETRALVNIRF